MVSFNAPTAVGLREYYRLLLSCLGRLNEAGLVIVGRTHAPGCSYKHARRPRPVPQCHPHLKLGDRHPKWSSSATAGLAPGC